MKKEFTWSEILKMFFIKIACLHKWKIHDETSIYESSGDEMPISTTQTLICRECGKIKRIFL